MTRHEAKELFRNDRNSYGQTRAQMRKLDIIFDSIMEEEVRLKLIISQLNSAVDEIANHSGDFTQNIVYDALINSGYYKDEEED